uniref:phosphoribosyltransferase-like protein n=1 Tax=Acetatifactor sp. TaxID=1872090 RepID=UPI004056E99F
MYDRNQLIDTHKRYINKGWYDSAISLDKLERWLDNFPIPASEGEFDTRLCAKFLLDAIVFYQTNHMVAIISSIINQKKSQLNEAKEKEYGRRLSEEEFEAEWNIYISESYVVAAAKPEDVGSSAHNAARHWRNTTGIDSGSVAGLKKAVLEQKKKHIFFVDDFVGTGSKIKKFLSDDLFPDRNTYGFLTIQEFMDENSDGIDYNVAVFAMCEEGYIKLSGLFNKLIFCYGDFYDKHFDLGNEEFFLYELYQKEKEHILEFIREKQTELDSGNRFALNLPISFSHGCPNNTLSLFYKNTSEWTGLFAETNPHHS